MPGATFDPVVSLRLSDLALLAGDCVEGAPSHRRSGSALKAKAETFRHPKREFEAVPRWADFSLRQPDQRWQTIVANDRWSWACAERLASLLRRSKPVRVQLVLEDRAGNTGCPRGRAGSSESDAGSRRLVIMDDSRYDLSSSDPAILVRSIGTDPRVECPSFRVPPTREPLSRRAGSDLQTGGAERR